MIVDNKVNKQYVGVYLIDRCIDGPQLATTSRPNGLKRLTTRLFLGWTWISVKKLKTKQEESKLKLKAEQEAKKTED